jgi:hypothetical protein
MRAQRSIVPWRTQDGAGRPQGKVVPWRELKPVGTGFRLDRPALAYRCGNVVYTAVERKTRLGIVHEAFCCASPRLLWHWLRMGLWRSSPFFSHCPLLLLGSCRWVWLALCLRFRLGRVDKSPPPAATQSLLIAFGAIFEELGWPSYPQVAAPNYRRF